MELETDRMVTVTIQATVPDVKLWSPSFPNQYTLRQVTTSGGRVVDEQEQVIGFRKLDARGRELYLNNEKLFLKMVTYCEFSPERGFCMNVNEIERDIILLNNLGAKAVRVYTLLPPEFYRALATHNALAGARKLWLLQGVWAELPAGNDFASTSYVAEFEAEIERVIDAVHGDLVTPPRPGQSRETFSQVEK